MPFTEKMIQDTARDRVVREESQIQSEWPAHTGSATASGYYYYSAGVSGSAVLLLSCPSSRWFKPRSLWITNDNANQNLICFYTLGSSPVASATLGTIRINDRTTEFIAWDTVTVGQDIWISALYASIAIRVGGILLASGPEN